MRRPGRRRFRRPIGLLLVLLLLWALVVLAMPTGWARRAIERRVAQSTGCPTRLESVRIGPLGGIWLHGLAIREPGPSAPPEPWLASRSIRVDLCPTELLFGRTSVRRVSVRGLALRVVRHEDGRFAPAFLLSNARPAPPAAPGSGRADATDRPILFSVAEGRVACVDRGSGTELTIDEVSGSGTWGASTTDVDWLGGTLNGGTFALAAEIERGPTPAFQGRLAMHGVHLGRGMGVLRYLMPYLAGVSGQLEGRLMLDVELRGQGASAAEVRDSLAGRGTMRVDPVRLDGSLLLIDLARMLPIAEYGKVGSVQTDFRIDRRRIESHKLVLQVGGTPVVLAGSADFDGRLDYRVDTAPFAGRLGPEMIGLLAELGLKPDDLLSLQVRGTTEHPSVHLGGLTFDSRDGGRSALDELARRLRERVLR